MIKIKDGIIKLETKNTSYIMSANRYGVLENLHYGEKIRIADPAALFVKRDAGFGCEVKVNSDTPSYSSLCLELSPHCRGDYRKGAVSAKMLHGAFTSSFTFKTAEVLQGSAAPHGGMPCAHGGEQTLAISFAENSGMQVQLFYTIFPESDIITRRMAITNLSPQEIELRQCFSFQLDLPRADLDLFTLNGAWAREAQLTKRSTSVGITAFGSGAGVSSNSCNPFFFLCEPSATEHSGEVYGFNLVYSGSHEGIVEVDNFGNTRILQGINSGDFSWTLKPGEIFTTPEAVMTFSPNGKNGMSQNMHHFIKNHIIPEKWNNTQRPVLLNNWEGTYFDFNEKALISMAKTAKDLGVELFVLDDGWFGGRNHDKAGLGDYDVNRKKLPSGMSGLSQKIKELGLLFGLWFEPEMVNEDSELFRLHPDWAVQTPGYAPCIGRNQYLLDICRPEVREYIINSVNSVLNNAEINYVKWDMNRNISDNYSPALASQGMFSHSYTLGLYQLFDGICRTHPNILFEGCASGGNRFDLGILCYMPQIWTSDDTDAYQRQKIQSGISYGYPLCTMGAHVSAVPNHQTLRNTPIETRFNTAAFGLLGYELDPRRLTMQDKQDIKAQISYYKQHRQLLQYGDFYRLISPFKEESCGWIVVSPNKDEALVGAYYHLVKPNYSRGPMRLAGLADNSMYSIKARVQKMGIETFGDLINQVLPVRVNPDGTLVKMAAKVYRLDTEKEEYLAFGSMLCKSGVRLLQDFSGSGYSDKMRLLEDFSSRLYYIEVVKN